MELAPGIVLLGGPAAGKSTQARMLAAAYEFEVLARGRILHEEVAQHSALGRRAASYLYAGALVPDELLGAILGERLARTGPQQNLLLDGFPRTVAQARLLDSLLAGLGRTLAAVIALAVRTEDAVQRLAGAASRDLVLHRLRVYDAATAPLLRHYAGRGILHVVTVAGPPESVQEEIVRVLATIPVVLRPAATAGDPR